MWKLSRNLNSKLSSENRLFFRGNNPGTLPDDPPDDGEIPPGTRPPTERRELSHPKKITCDFCECEINTMQGEVLTFSKKAKALRDTSETFEKMQGQIDTLKSENADLKNQIQLLKGVETPKKKGSWDIS